MSLQHQDKSREHRSGKSTVEFAEIKGTDLKVSRVGLGTWAIGGSMWGGTDEVNPIETIRAALALGLNIIDTAPVYGFGRSACGPTPSSRAMTSACTIRNSRRHALGNIWKPSSNSISSRMSAIRAACSISPCAGYSIRASRRRCGARGVRTISGRLARSWAGTSTA